MKKVLIALIIILLLAVACKNASQMAGAEKFSLKLEQDSGYICTDKAMQFLLDKNLIDTAGTDNKYGIDCAITRQLTKDTIEYYDTWYYDRQADNVGKYYRFGNTGNYIACISLSRFFILLELSPDSKIVASELFGCGSHACCVETIDDYLKKYGDYFGILTCGSGSDCYCSTGLWLFRNQLPNGHAGELITVACHYCFSYLFCQLSSSIRFVNDTTLMVHYTYEEKKLEIDDDEIEDAAAIEPAPVKHFTVKYEYKNGQWTTSEKYIFEKYKIRCD